MKNSKCIAYWLAEGFWSLIDTFYLYVASSEWWGSHATRRKRSWENDCRSLCSAASSIPFNWKVLFSSFLYIYLLLHLSFAYSESKTFLQYTVRVHATPLPIVSQIATWLFLYLYWKDLWYAFVLKNIFTDEGYWMKRI